MKSASMMRWILQGPHTAMSFRLKKGRAHFNLGTSRIPPGEDGIYTMICGPKVQELRTTRWLHGIEGQLSPSSDFILPVCQAGNYPSSLGSTRHEGCGNTLCNLRSEQSYTKWDWTSFLSFDASWSTCMVNLPTDFRPTKNGKMRRSGSGHPYLDDRPSFEHE